MFELFAFYLQAGLIDVAFLGGAQIDRFGNLNTTVIGDYANPKVRLPGSGGACEIAIHARQILVIMRQAQRSFVDTLDFRTSPGHSGDPAHDAARGWHGNGPTAVVTDLGTYGFDEATGEMTLRTMHPGVALEDVRANMGWEPTIADDLGETPMPTDEELRLDPRGVGPRGDLYEVIMSDRDDHLWREGDEEPEPDWAEQIRAARKARGDKLRGCSPRSMRTTRRRRSARQGATAAG